jgi:DNA-directed RNA polymerase subunit RPC12/RpoP
MKECKCCGKPLAPVAGNTKYCKPEAKGEISECQKWGKNKLMDRKRDRYNNIKSLKAERNTEVWCLRCGKNFKSVNKFTNRVCEKCTINNSKRTYRIYNRTYTHHHRR